MLQGSRIRLNSSFGAALLRSTLSSVRTMSQFRVLDRPFTWFVVYTKYLFVHYAPCYFPMETKDDADREYARAAGLAITRTRLGNRVIEAIMIPCKRVAYDSRGREVYLEMPSEEQREIYLSYIRNEMNEQDAMKRDGRCCIPDGAGGLKRCPCRVPNPAYTPGGTETKTIPVNCEGCKYEPYRQAHTTITLSSLAGEDGETYDIPTPSSSPEGDRYERMCRDFERFVEARYPRLAPLAKALMREFTKSEYSRSSGVSTSSVSRQADKLKALVEEFLESESYLYKSPRALFCSGVNTFH